MKHRDALETVTVVEFGGYAAGPAIGKYLANFGARVIHVESLGRPDGFRLQYPPYKDDRVGVNRSAMEQTDWHRQAEDSLMREVASDLLADLRRQEFSKLILAAAPIALGTLRRAMSDELKAAILAEVDKDLTKMPVPEIGAALAKALEAA